MINCCVAIIVGFGSLLVAGVAECLVCGIVDKHRGKVKSIFAYLKEEW